MSCCRITSHNMDCYMLVGVALLVSCALAKPQYGEIRFDDAPEMQEFNLDEDVLVTCAVSGKPTPHVTWSHHGKAISTGGRYKQSSNGLWIHKLSYRDEGAYTCTATIEKYGLVDSRRIHVTVSDE